MSTEQKVRVRRQRSIYQVHYGIPKPQELEIPESYNFLENVSQLELKKYESQVAGHKFADRQKYIGLLKCSNGMLLKPIIKPDEHIREKLFYEHITNTKNEELIALKSFIPKYYGSRVFTYNEFESEYLLLEDLIKDMLEPCIMDVKVGKQTWDPFATQEKKEREQQKYVECKQALSFCIPGFQLYHLSTGKFQKYNKDYGKKLNGQTAKEALKIFLNIEGDRLCRSLVLQFLTEMWKIQKWASKQTAIKLYSTSLLLAYDVNGLRKCCGPTEGSSERKKCVVERPIRNSAHSLCSSETAIAGSNFSGQISPNGPIYKRINSAPLSAISQAQSAFAEDNPTNNNTWHVALSNIKRSHSFHNNYDDNLSKIKMNYHSLLGDLVNESRKKKSWVNVKIIDFAHAVWMEEDTTPDTNFKEGINSIVKIFEEFLRETDALAQ